MSQRPGACLLAPASQAEGRRQTRAPSATAPAAASLHHCRQLCRPPLPPLPVLAPPRLPPLASQTGCSKKVMDPEVPQALRLQAILVGGIVLVHARQQLYLLEDAQEMLVGGWVGGWVGGCLVGPSRALGGCWQVVGAVGCWRVLGQPPPWAGISASRRCRAAVPPAPCPDRHMAATLNRHHPPAGPWPLDLRQTRPPALPHCASPPCSAACGCSTQRGRAPPM